MKKVLLFRMSAIGDVAMLIPVIYSAAKHHPEIHFTFLTQSFLLPLFVSKPDNLEIVGFDLKGNEGSFAGFLRALKPFLSQGYDLVLDLHDVLRSKIMRVYLKIRASISFVVIDKGRKEKKRLTRRREKVFVPLKSTFERYHETFEKAGIFFPLDFVSVLDGANVSLPAIFSGFFPKTGKWIGIAPFAKHQGKIYPLSAMERIVKSLSANEDYRLFLFGGKGEQKILEEWAMRYPNTSSMAGRASLKDEIVFMSYLDLFVSMDSANMHFASLVNAPVLSFWGQTHPYAGFYPWKQPLSNALQASLACRPCSVFGNKDCYRHDWACLRMVPEQDFLNRISAILQKS
ncbi:MAG: glycosyltransferase family 9 protein [Bacteroidales bacterium]|nr:glycosyltransferase family 9 protein [Bacteroidales bacterium]